MSVRRTDFCEVWAWVFGDNSLGFVFTCVLLCLLGLKSNHRRLFSACLSRNTCFKKKKREKKNHSLKKSLVFRESQETSSVLIETAAQEQLQKSCNKDCLIMFFWRSRWGPAQAGMELLAVGLPSVPIGFWPRSLWVPRSCWHCTGSDLCLWQRGVSTGLCMEARAGNCKSVYGETFKAKFLSHFALLPLLSLCMMLLTLPCTTSASRHYLSWLTASWSSTSTLTRWPQIHNCICK